MKPMLARWRRRSAPLLPPDATIPPGTPGTPGTLGAWTRLRQWLGRRKSVWLTLTWDVGGMSAALMDAGTPGHPVVARAWARSARFDTALAQVLQDFRTQAAPTPRRVVLAARHVVPTVLTQLPIDPENPRKPVQMRELLQTDLEQPLAEFGSLWSLGAVLQARGFLSAPQREQVTMEEALRRQNRAHQLRYGEIAIELGLIDRAALDECLDLQAAMQSLDAQLWAGWCGRTQDKHPLWLACGVGRTTFQEWEDALAAHGLRLDVALPLAWLAGADSASDRGADPRKETWRVDLELHTEELVAVQYCNGLVVAARSEGRVERSLSADWLLRVVGDWVTEPRVQLRVLCLHASDDVQCEALAQNLTLLSGHPCETLTSHQTNDHLWRNLLAHALAAPAQLPRIALSEQSGPLLAQPDVRRALCLGSVVLALVAVEGGQRYRLAGLQARLQTQQDTEKQRTSTQQLTQQANQRLRELGDGLEKTRAELAPLLTERSRLVRIVAMRRDLPELLYQLAQAVGNDAVIEEIHHDSTRATTAAIQVIAWSPSYTGAQDFVNRMAALARSQGYGVAQTEIKERAGRDGRKGHELKFWLLWEDSELEADGSTAPSAAAPSPPRATISAANTAIPPDTGARKP